ncbi:MAG: hypothetical protein JWM80_3422, partial [Cyanobacteria bacterium RYN_339]|nr:hypothetical protein [Cyanobacteria bacterium RYN_339]
NLVGNSGGTYRHLAQATDVIDALAIRPSGQVNPQVVPGESRPVAHAVVYLTDAEGHPLPGVPYAVTDDKGYYFFAGLPTNKPVVATVPFMPASIVAQGGGNIVAQGGGNIVAQGGGNIVAQGGGNFGLLATLETDTAKASPKVIAMPTTLDHLPTDAGNGVAAIAGRNGLDLPRPGERAVQETHDNNGDISLATTLTSNLVLAGQQGQVIEVSQAQFDLVVERVADALLSAPLSSVFQPVPEVPLLVDIRKLDLPEGTDLTFRQRDKDLVDNEAARQQAAAELAKLAGDAKQPKEAELVRLEAEAKRLAQAKIAALFDLASQLKAKLNLSVKTDNEPIGQDQTGSRGLDRPTDDPGTTDPTPAPAPAQPAAEPDGLPSDDPTPSPDVDATGAVNVTPGNVTNAGTEGVL